MHQTQHLRYAPLRSRLSTLPVGLRGRASRNTKSRGTSRTACARAASVALRGGRAAPGPPGILHQMQKAAPGKTFIAAPPEANCACNECPHMKKNTLEKVYLALRDLEPKLVMRPDLIEKARAPIDRMLELS